MPTFADGALTLELGGEVARLILARPERRNALNQAMWRALADVAAAVDKAACVKVLIVEGSGGHFAAGADIAEFETVCATRELAGAYSAAVHDGLFAIARMAKPSIARIEGFCVGGGMALALACDIRLADEAARVAITPAKLGIVYNAFDTRLLVDAVGGSAARDLLFTGRMVDATEALRLGLVDAVHSGGGLEAAVTDKAGLLCANSQWSIRQAKRMVRRALDGQERDDAVTRGVSVDSFTGPDFAEGRAAFMAKRAPDFRWDGEI